MRENSLLPEINIDGDVFFIDVQNLLLQDQLDESNGILFSEMEGSVADFTFIYRPSSRTIFRGTEHDKKYCGVLFTVHLDVSKYLEQTQYKEYDPMRKMPTVNIGGTEFYVDSRLQEFRQVDNEFNAIEFHECLEHDKGLSLQFDLAKKTIFHGTPEEAKQRKDDIKLVKLKPLYQLDPLGWIERRGQANENSNRQMRRSR